METRLIFAYALIVLMALAVGALLFRAWYNVHPRATARRRLREHRHRDERANAQNSRAGTDT